MNCGMNFGIKQNFQSDRFFFFVRSSSIRHCSSIKWHFYLSPPRCFYVPKQAARSPVIQTTWQASFTSEISWSDHHGSRLEWIAGSSKVMPLNAIELADVVTHGVVDSIKVGQTTSIKPPAWMNDKWEEIEINT